MREANPIEQLQRRLIELGCPVKAVRKIVRETAEHYEDLQKAALTQGMSSAEAIARATELLGEPRQLAERHVEALRNSSWMGRHPFWGIVVMPMGLVLAIGLLYWWCNADGFPLAPQFTSFPIHYPWIWAWMFPLFCGIILMFIGLVTVYFCRVCLRAGLGRRWMWAVGGLLAIHSLFLHIDPCQGINLTSPPKVIKDEKTTSERRMQIDIMPGAYSPAIFSKYRWPDTKDVPKGMPNPILVIVRGENWIPEWMPLHDSTLEGQLAAGLVDPQSQLLSPVASFWQSGWTAGASSLIHGAYHRIFEARISIQVGFGHLVWSRSETMSAPLPVMSYGWPGFGSPGLGGEGEWFYWLNVLLPLLVVALMQAWQQRGTRRLLGESELGGAQLAGVE